MGNAEGVSHGQRLVAACCKVCGMGYEMVGLVFVFPFLKNKNEVHFCCNHGIGLGISKMHFTFVFVFGAVRTALLA